jgi:hypothetical protein
VLRSAFGRADDSTPLRCARDSCVGCSARRAGHDARGVRQPKAGDRIVARGKLADLVLLDANPLSDIRIATRVQAVVANSRYFDRAALDTLLAAVERIAAEGSKEMKRR